MDSKTYKSAWDWMPWTAMAFTALCCGVPMLFDGFDWLLATITVLSLAFELVTFISIYYKIVDDELWVYTFFKPSKFPISKIAEIKPTKSPISSPAVSITKRIAIKFTDRSVLKSSMPLIISPKDQAEFIAHLNSINPNIKS